MRAAGLLLLAAACATAPVTPPALPAPQRLVPGVLQEGPTTAATLAGRKFDLTVLSATPAGGATKWSLQIIGDAMIVSFAAQAPPHAPSVSGDVVGFGGHTFEATAKPNDYKVDGAALHLDPGGAYAISEGRFLGRVR